MSPTGRAATSTRSELPETPQSDRIVSNQTEGDTSCQMNTETRSPTMTRSSRRRCTRTRTDANEDIKGDVEAFKSNDPKQLQQDNIEGDD